MFVLNPAWPHFVGGFSIILACILGVTRFLLGGKKFLLEELIHPDLKLSSGWLDPLHCNALLNRGSWLDSDHKNWQPDGA